MIDRRAFTLALMATLAPLPAVAQSADDPAAPIAAIYERAGGGGHGGRFVWMKNGDRKRWMSRGLVSLWNKAAAKTKKGDQAPLGFDPISNSQDPGVRAPRVTLKRRDANSATVAVSFVGWGEAPQRMTVIYDMVRERNLVRSASRWLIDDIRGTVDGKDWSVRQLLLNWKG